MSNFGLFASRYRDNTNCLRQFDEALRYFKRPDLEKDSREVQEQIRKLLFVLKPIAEMLSGRLSKTVNFDEQSILEILQQRHRTDWQRYSDRIIRLNSKFVSGNTDITENDFETLNDVADAIDTECANLFRRMSGRT